MRVTVDTPLFGPFHVLVSHFALKYDSQRSKEPSHMSEPERCIALVQPLSRCVVSCLLFLALPPPSLSHSVFLSFLQRGTFSLFFAFLAIRLVSSNSLMLSLSQIFSSFSHPFSLVSFSLPCSLFLSLSIAAQSLVFLPSSFVSFSVSFLCSLFSLFPAISLYALFFSVFSLLLFPH